MMKQKETEHPKQVQGDIQKSTNQDTFYMQFLTDGTQKDASYKQIICIMNVMFFKLVQWTDKIIII